MNVKKTNVAANIMFLIIFCSLAVAEHRSIDGSGNNLNNPLWGSVGSTLKRATEAAYSDGVSAPAGTNRPSARMISNTILYQKKSIPNTFGRSDYIWAWGQFIDHEIDLAGVEPLEPFDIVVPPGDPVFDPNDAGGVYILFDRSEHDLSTGTGDDNPRQQTNLLSAWIDASMVYGSDAERAAWLREGCGGRMKVSSHPTGDMLPYNDGTQPNAGGSGADLFVAGDVRANEHAILTCLHTLFVREHNRLTSHIACANPGLTDEQIYQKARRMVGAEIQVITFNEFLPALLGQDDLPPYCGYDSRIEPTVTNEFGTGAYRFGHSAVSPVVLRFDKDMQEIPYGHLVLEEAFFDPERITEEGGIDPVLRGLTWQLHQQIDVYVVDSLRDNLFATLDLSSLNIQRGRDHGLCDYNSMRTGFGLEAFTSFAELTNDAKVHSALAATYGTIDNVDPWVGMLAEHNHDGSLVGGLRHTIIKDQFQRLRDGDRFFYANDTAFSKDERAFLKSMKLKDIIELNTDIRGLPDDVFSVPMSHGKPGHGKPGHDKPGDDNQDDSNQNDGFLSDGYDIY